MYISLLNLKSENTIFEIPQNSELKKSALLPIKSSRQNPFKTHKLLLDELKMRWNWRRIWMENLNSLIRRNARLCIWQNDMTLKNISAGWKYNYDNLWIN